PSSSRSKLARALGDPVTGGCAAGGPTPGRAAGRRELRPGRAGAVVTAHLRELVGLLTRYDPPARTDERDAVHQMRVATRRLRSALATFRPLLDRTVTDPLREELAWLGAELGAVRDAEVIRDRLLDDLAEEPAELVLGPVRERVAGTLGDRHRAAHDNLLRELERPRYFALLDALDALVADPPLSPLAGRRAERVLPALAARTWRRTRRLVRAAAAATDPVPRDLALHEVRKAAKRARYAGEALAAEYGRPARRYAAGMKAVQDALGAHQDTVVIRQELRGLAEQAQASGEPSFTYGRLHAREEDRAALSEAAFAQAWCRVRAPGLHGR
ncbi:MAG TPA: CHAD domain-containing protein, partial [Kineosporiaceae bacterium]|nr:CHAD domain-containing protein [Kineosporiaceae bacterium]